MSLIDTVEKATGYRFKDEALLTEALTHASCADDRLKSNERMEFLGDAVLGMVVCQYLYETFPDELEGQMTKIKSHVVSRKTCAEISLELGLCDLLTLGKGMTRRGNRHTGGGVPSSVSAAVLESIIAGIYLDGGFEAAAEFILSQVSGRIHSTADNHHQQNFKSVLQQHAQRNLPSNPMYLLLDEKGPDHCKCFEVCVELDETRFPSAWANAKKDAEQKAALLALESLGLAEVDEETGEVQLVGMELSES